MYIIDGIKKRLHRDVAADPATHGWVLNLYLNGERYPQTVCDYFQADYAPSRELAGQIRLHEKDEHKHELILAKAIRSLGQEVIELPRIDIFNVVIRMFTPGTFHIIAADSEEIRREKLANFMAHCHFLEKRVARSLCYQADASHDSKSPMVGKAVHAVLADEGRHVRYTIDAVKDLVTRRRAEAILDEHRRAEARANVRFSHMQMHNFLASFAGHVPRQRRLAYRICGAFMEGMDRMM
ncbi:MAG TPA: hypothetical protein VFE47_21705 [Tepidisphaeraceae bacterium]|jgi:hypothetical protein|nr:hypothetical protein [Tepidisphaeraceae bacterium]